MYKISKILCKHCLIKNISTFLQSYYKHKGTRPPTRPNEIQDSFEVCIDSLIAKCQKYRVQAEDYRNDCIEGKQ